MQDILFDFISKYIALTNEEKKAILALDLFRSVKKGTTLLKEGQVPHEKFFGIKGCIRVYSVIGGEEKTGAGFRVPQLFPMIFTELKVYQLLRETGKL